MIELFTQYKARQAGKATFRVSAYQTSQECAECEHTHSDNRTSQETFECVACHHVDNADNNASKVIKSRAIKLIKDSGTELTERGVLRSVIGRGGNSKSSKQKCDLACALGNVKKEGVAA